MYQFVVTLLEPFTLVLVCVFLTTLLLWRAERRRRLCMAGLSTLLAILMVICFQPAGRLAVGSLERSYPPLEELPPEVDTIVVLSGGLRAYDESGEQYELASNTAFRCLHAAELYRRAEGCRIVVSGGKVDPARPGPTHAGAMHDFLVEIGVEPSDILVEEESRTTYENAVYTLKLLEQEQIGRIALVTDATHMFRSVRCFRGLGVDVVPAPCNHRATWYEWSAATFLPSLDGAERFRTAFHEWLGVAWYWLHGRL